MEDTRILHWGDLPAALGLLTRLPVPVDAKHARMRGAAAVWAYPLVGVVVGGLQAVFAGLLLWLGLPAALVSALVVALSVIVTGALHEDGLADCADGFWGGWSAERRLEIMKDSHIGSYGVIALVLSILIQWLATAALLQHNSFAPALVAAAVLGRTGMVAVMAVLPHARDDGLSRQVGKPPPRAALLALVIGAGLGLILVTPLATLAALAAAACCGAIAKGKIGGQTGDVLGATQQIGSLAVLIFLVVTNS